MRALLCLILMGSLVAQDLSIGKNQQPQVTKPFHITYDDLPHASMNRFLNQTKGTVLVQFVINEYGEVIEPEIIDTFNIELNDAIIDNVMCIQFEPATQNGRPVKVRYNLPILFK